MGTEPVTKLIFQMALPAVVAQLVNLLYNIVDRIYIGHIADHGADALAGVGICSTLIILISAFASFAGGGGAPLHRWRWDAGTDGWLREFWATVLRWICFSR